MAAHSVKEEKITTWLATQREAMIELLKDVVNIDSGSYDKPGVDAVGARFIEFFDEHNIPTTIIKGKEFGNGIRACVGNDDGAKASVLMMGHRDTVFPKGEAAKRPFTIKGNRAYGPGVADMKCGLVMNAFILAAFQKFGAPESGPLVALITGDEEIGSPFSKSVIEDEARNAKYALNSEPGRGLGRVVTGRKGGIFMAMEVIGVAAHSGGAPQDGRSAIGELAHKITALHALTDFDRGITVNVGLISGGQSVNTTAPHAQARIDLRYITPDEREEAMSAIDKIITNCTIEGTSASYSIQGEFRPLVPTPEQTGLFNLYGEAAQHYGLNDIEAVFTGGCADSGFSAAVGTPTICGVGPVGAHVHTPEEFMELDTLVPRAQFAAITVNRLDVKS